eukprot:4418906-Pyramimonas_sp.AAC.1
MGGEIYTIWFEHITGRKVAVEGGIQTSRYKASSSNVLAPDPLWRGLPRLVLCFGELGAIVIHSAPQVDGAAAIGGAEGYDAGANPAGADAERNTIDSELSQGISSLLGDADVGANDLVQMASKIQQQVFRKSGL